MFVKGVGNLVTVTDRDVIYFHILYYLVALTTRHEVVTHSFPSRFPSPSSISFGLNRTIVIVGCLSGFHFIVDSISEISVIAPVLTTLLMFKQAILKPRLAGKELDILEGPELPE